MNEKSLSRRLARLEETLKLPPLPEDCRDSEEWQAVSTAFQLTMKAFPQIEVSVSAALVTIAEKVCITLKEACNLLVAAIEDCMPARVWLADLLVEGEARNKAGLNPFDKTEDESA